MGQVEIFGSSDFKCPFCGSEEMVANVLPTQQGAMAVLSVVGKGKIMPGGQGIQVPEGRMCVLCGGCMKPVPLDELLKKQQEDKNQKEEGQEKKEEGE